MAPTVEEGWSVDSERRFRLQSGESVRLTTWIQKDRGLLRFDCPLESGGTLSALCSEAEFDDLCRRTGHTTWQLRWDAATRNLLATAPVALPTNPSEVPRPAAVPATDRCAAPAAPVALANPSELPRPAALPATDRCAAPAATLAFSEGCAGGTARLAGDAESCAAGPEASTTLLVEALSKLLKPLGLDGALELRSPEEKPVSDSARLRGLLQPDTVRLPEPHIRRTQDGSFRQEVCFVRVQEAPHIPARGGWKDRMGPPGELRRCGGGWEFAEAAKAQARSSGLDAVGDVVQSVTSDARRAAFADSAEEGKHSSTFKRAWSLGLRPAGGVGDSADDRPSTPAEDPVRAAQRRVSSASRARLHSRERRPSLPSSASASEALQSLLKAFGLSSGATDSDSAADGAAPRVLRATLPVGSPWIVELCYVCADRIAERIVERVVEKPVEKVVTKVETRYVEKVVEVVKHVEIIKHQFTALEKPVVKTVVVEPPRPHTSEASTQTEDWCTECGAYGHLALFCPALTKDERGTHIRSMQGRLSPSIGARSFGHDMHGKKESARSFGARLSLESDDLSTSSTRNVTSLVRRARPRSAPLHHPGKMRSSSTTSSTAPGSCRTSCTGSTDDVAGTAFVSPSGSAGRALLRQRQEERRPGKPSIRSAFSASAGQDHLGTVTRVNSARESLQRAPRALSDTLCRVDSMIETLQRGSGSLLDSIGTSVRPLQRVDGGLSGGLTENLATFSGKQTSASNETTAPSTTDQGLPTLLAGGKFKI